MLYISFDWRVCAFVVLGFVFPYQAKRLGWERPQNELLLYRARRKTTTQLISHHLCCNGCFPGGSGFAIMIPMHMMIREIIPGRKYRVRQCRL